MTKRISVVMIGLTADSEGAIGAGEEKSRRMPLPRGRPGGRHPVTP